MQTLRRLLGTAASKLELAIRDLQRSHWQREAIRLDGTPSQVSKVDGRWSIALAVASLIVNRRSFAMCGLICLRPRPTGGHLWAGLLKLGSQTQPLNDRDWQLSRLSRWLTRIVLEGSRWTSNVPVQEYGVRMGTRSCSGS